MFQSPGAIALHLGPLAIRWYGILIGAGILLCYSYVSAELKRRKIPQKPVDDMAFWVIASGIVGARMYYVLFTFSYYSAHPIEIFKIWNGGLAIHGALIGGAAAYFVYVIRHKISWRLYADVMMPGILLAQAIGRFGNFFNNEAFGSPTSLPWKLFIPAESRPPGLEDFSYFHPTFLYESLWNFAGFFLLVFLSRKIFRSEAHIKHQGAIFCSYLIWYSIGRFAVESLRTDSLYLGPFRIAQVVSIILFLLGIFGLLFIKSRARIKAI